MALAVLANVYLFHSSSHRKQVVRVIRDVPVGQAISRADLGTAMVAVDAGVQTIPGRQLAEVVGRRAAVDLRHGTLLTASQVTAQLTPQPGQALVTVAVKPSLLPPRGLAAGSQVRVVATPGGQGQGSVPQSRPGPGPAGQEVTATVDQVGGPDAEGLMTVSLLVADADSSAVARQSSIALVVTARGG
jgi:hypothetical protein